MKSTRLFWFWIGLFFLTACNDPQASRLPSVNPPESPPSASPAPGEPPPLEETPRPTRDLKLLTYNVWGLPAPLLRHKSRFADIERLLPTLQADIVGFQEAFTESAEGLSRLETYPHIAWGPKKKFLKLSSGLLTISKYPIVEAAEMTYANCAGVDCLARKGVLFTRIDVPEIGFVDVFNTHLNANASDKILLKQIDELARFIDAQAGTELVVVMGDFNLIPGSAPYAKFQDLVNFRDVHAAFLEEADPATVPELDRDAYTADPRRNSHLKLSKKGTRRLDYLWYRDSAMQRAQAVRSTLVMDGLVNGRHLSDHFGLLGVLRVTLP